MARRSFWTTPRTCMSGHSCLPAQPVLAPTPPDEQLLRLGPWLSFAAWPSSQPPWPTMPAASFQPQPEFLYTSARASHLLSVALALGFLQALALLAAAVPRTLAFLSPSLCSQALIHLPWLLTRKSYMLLSLPRARQPPSGPPPLSWPPPLLLRPFLTLWKRGPSPGSLGCWPG